MVSQTRLRLAAALAAALLASGAATPPPPVRAWMATIDLPTTVEGPANLNAPFDLFTFTRFNYPYPLRDTLTDRREVQHWRTLHLENEFLRLTVLPDAGGHVYSCLDKTTGRDLFYANPSIKKALIGYRGAWAAFGVEFNFPVSHNWVSMSPVDFALQTHPDGRASIVVGNVDAVYGGAWRVELSLRPGRAVLDQAVTLQNRSTARHRYYWWTNAAAEVWDDSRLVYPTELMATHGFTQVQPWPVDASNRDLSVIRNQTDGPVSLFTYGTREPYVGVYHPRTHAGTVHLASPAQLPTHKVWSWGADAEAMAWREALSDNKSAYIELQAGLFRNQETYGFLEPQETVRFEEHWLPVHDIGGITRATIDAVFHGERHDAGKSLTAGVNVTRRVPEARLRVTQQDRTLLDTSATLSPNGVWRQEVAGLRGDAPWTFELRDVSGRVLLTHTEGKYDVEPRAGARIGAQPIYRYPAADARQAQDIVELGHDQEVDGKRLIALATYRDGLQRFADSVALSKAAGRLATALHWGEAGAGTTADQPSWPVRWLSKAMARDTSDAETRYYLGIALAGEGHETAARGHWEAAARFRQTGPAARVELARLAARGHDFARALNETGALLDADPDNVFAGALDVTLRRLAGKPVEARHALTRWRNVDRSSSWLRFEHTRLGGDDPTLWEHLGADPQRIFDLVDQYLAFGAWSDAQALLDREYPVMNEPAREPGVVPPARHALLAYYRAFVRERLGLDAKAAYIAASKLPLAYVFPNRASSYSVLRAALRANPNDAAAHALLGSLLLSGGLVDEAIAEYQRARVLRPDIPGLHRNLGLALLLGTGNTDEARRVFVEGVTHDPTNVENYEGLDRVLSMTAAPATDRVAALKRFPTTPSLPPGLVFKLALALAEQGDADGAEALFKDRFFPREEGGTSVRTVYAQVRLIRATHAVRARRCDDATAVLDSLEREQPSLAFMRGGLADVIRPATFQAQIAAIERACGREGTAQQRQSRLAQAAGGAPLQTALAYEAARALGRDDANAWRPRLTEALAAATRTIEEGNAAGTVQLARGLLLRGLGREREAREAFASVFRLPDRSLSYALARAALRGDEKQTLP